MNKIKYISIIFLLFFGFLIPGELYQRYMDDFSDFYTVSFSFDGTVTKNKMLNDISRSAEENDVKIFLMTESMINKFNKQIVIYCNDKTKSYLEDFYYVHNGKINSVFCGSTTVTFKSFNSAPQDLINNIKTNYYLIGDLTNMHKMKSELCDIYGGGFPEEDGENRFDEVKNIMLGIWCIIIVLVCFISYYSLNNSQREYVVRASMGDTLRSIYVKLILTDTVCIVSFSVFFLLGLRLFTYSNFLQTISITAIIVCIILNALINLRIFGYHVRAAFQNAAGHKEIIIGNYFLKVFTCTLTTILLVTEISAVVGCLKFYKQEDFFKAHSDYQYYQLIATDKKNNNNRDLVSEQFYRNFYTKIEFIDPIYNNGQNDIFFTTSTSISWLKKWVKELDSVETFGDICILIPANINYSDGEIDDISNFAEYYFEQDTNLTTQVINYNNASIIGIEDGFLNKSEWIENPIIVMLNGQKFDLLNEYDIQSNKAESTIGIPRDYNCMVNASEEELISFAEKYGYNIEIMNVYSYYLYRKTIIQRSLYLCSILIIFIIILEISITTIIFKMEYQYKAIELTVQKILGYKNIERHRKIYVTTFLSIIIGGVVSPIVLHIIGLFNIGSILITLTIISVIEISIIYKYSQKYENENIQQILKGGKI